MSRTPRTKPTVAPLEGAAVPAVPPISLVVVDDSALLREGLTAIIGSEPGFKVLAAAKGDDLLDKVREAKPDVVLLDLGLADDDGLAITKRVHGEVPTVKVIVMGLLPVPEEVADYVRAGASGFIMKDAPLEEFFATIRAVVGGVEVLPKVLTISLFTQIAAGATSESRDPVPESLHLSSLERQVIALIGAGRTDGEIAEQLGISVRAVKGHAHNVLEKLALQRRLDARENPHSA